MRITNDERLLRHLAKCAVSMVALEAFPPRGLTSDEARQTAQRLVAEGKVYVNDELLFEVCK